MRSPKQSGAMLMPTLTPALVARRSEIPSNRTPRSVSTHALSDTFDMMGAPMSFSHNEEIYGEGEPADYLYKVVHGAVRMYKVLNDGRRQIGAFYLPGDMFGFESGDEHASSAEAVGDVTVLVFKRTAVLTLALRDGDVARQLWEITAHELDRSHKHSLLLILSAQERVASFLIEMADRSCASDEIELPMSRQDIADYLGLTIETVSRTLTQLESVGAIGVLAARRITFRNVGTLNRLNAC
jgi:CRP/FNR family transcriptional regulator, nitrogen fixation regulation protein